MRGSMIGERRPSLPDLGFGDPCWFRGHDELAFIHVRQQAGLRTYCRGIEMCHVLIALLFAATVSATGCRLSGRSGR